MMKTKLLCLLLTALCTTYIQAQTFQKSVTTNDQRHFHDLNTEPANDGTGDFFIAGNLFDASMQIYTPVLKRVDELGNIIGLNTYTTTLPNARFFDIQPYRILGLPNEIAITGSIDVGGVKNVFIAKVNASSGALIGAKNYAIPSPNFNSRGLHISYVYNDANGDGIDEEGFVVGGFYSDSYGVTTNSMNTGFVLRVYSTLSVFWVAAVNSPSTNQDFDAVNKITETSDGYFLTGSTNDAATSQLSILAQKIDFQGNLTWDKSHVFGNSQDISVDAYFDSSSQKIYMLANYSVSHLFGVTVLNNTTGAINTGQSWYATSNDLNRYGFTIMESLQNGNNLVISGYDRNETWTTTGTTYTGQSNLFVYEFEKNTGNPVALNYQYLVTHIEPTGDEFNFWNGQMPLIYYPDISFGRTSATGENHYFHVGYKTDPVINFTEADMFKTLADKRNECDRIDIPMNQAPLSYNPVNAIAVLTDYQEDDFPLNFVEVPTQVRDCSPTLSVIDNNFEEGHLYPNPASNIVYYTMQNASKYVIYDCMGRKIKSEPILNDHAIYVGDLPQGIYFVTLANEENMQTTIRLIKK